MGERDLELGHAGVGRSGIAGLRDRASPASLASTAGAARAKPAAAGAAGRALARVQRERAARRAGALRDRGDRGHHHDRRAGRSASPPTASPACRSIRRWCSGRRRASRGGFPAFEAALALRDARAQRRAAGAGGAVLRAGRRLRGGRRSSRGSAGRRCSTAAPRGSSAGTRRAYDGGDHLIVVGEVLRLEQADLPPLLYHRGGYCGLAAAELALGPRSAVGGRPNAEPGTRMAKDKEKKPRRPRAETPKGFRDYFGAEVRARAAMLARIMRGLPRLGLRSAGDERGRDGRGAGQVPARRRPAERGGLRLAGRGRAVAGAALRPDGAAGAGLSPSTG